MANVIAGIGVVVDLLVVLGGRLGEVLVLCGVIGGWTQPAIAPQSARLTSNRPPAGRAQSFENHTYPGDDSRVPNIPRGFLFPFKGEDKIGRRYGAWAAGEVWQV